MHDADRRLAHLPDAEPCDAFLAVLASRSAVPATPSSSSHRAARAVLGTAALAGALGGGAVLGATGHLATASAVVQGSRTQAMALTAAAVRMPAPAPPRETQSGRDWTGSLLTSDGSALRVLPAVAVAPTDQRCLAAAEGRLRRPIAVVDHATYDGVPALVLIGDGSGPVAALVTDPPCSRVLAQFMPGG